MKSELLDLMLWSNKRADGKFMMFIVAIGFSLCFLMVNSQDDNLVKSISFTIFFIVVTLVTTELCLRSINRRNK